MIVEDVKTKLVTLLSSFVNPLNIYLQGTLNPDEEYPNEFFTFFITTTELESHYDDNSQRTDLYISVMYYSNNPVDVSQIADKIMPAMKENGFVPTDSGNDIASDVQTHTGWAMDFAYPAYH